MSEPLEALFHMPARHLEAVFIELHALQARQASGESLNIPLITLLLASGHSVSGQFVDYLAGEMEEASVVLLHTGDSWTSLDATYIPLDAVQAVTVHHTKDSLEGFPPHPPPPEGPLGSSTPAEPSPAPSPRRLVKKRS